VQKTNVVHVCIGVDKNRFAHKQNKKKKKKKKKKIARKRVPRGMPVAAVEPRDRRAHLDNVALYRGHGAADRVVADVERVQRPQQRERAEVFKMRQRVAAHQEHLERAPQRVRVRGTAPGGDVIVIALMNGQPLMFFF
jgi:hypothetical protein